MYTMICDRTVGHITRNHLILSPPVSIFLHMHRLFEIAPELIEIFPFDGEDLDDDNVSLKKHAMQVMQSIDDALGMADQPEELKETLIGLGVVHNMSNVDLKSFAVSQHFFTVGSG